MSVTTTLVDFAHDLSLDDVPSEVLDRLGVLLADNLVVGLVGSRQPWHRSVLSAQQRFAGTGSVWLFGSDSRLDPPRAALVNGVAISGFELEHAHEGGHAGATAFPALLSLAVDRDVDPDAALLGLVAGYEIGLRVGLGLTGAAERERGFHRPAVSGVFGAATATSVALGLGAERLRSALGIAGSHACGIIAFTQDGSETKRLHLGRAAQLGLESTLLSEAGLTGPSEVLDGAYNLFAAYSPAPDTDAVLTDLGKRWELADSLVKPYNAHGECQAAVTAARRLAEAEPIDLDSIERIVLHTTSNGGETRYHRTTCRTALDAQYSLPLMIALSLVVDPRETQEFWTLPGTDPQIARAAERVEIVAEPERFGRRAMTGGGELEIHTRSGVRRALVPPRPMPEDLEASRQIVDDKLSRARRLTPAGPAEEVCADIAQRLLHGDLPVEGALATLAGL